MRAWTSYFASPRLRGRRDLVRVNITTWPPKWPCAFHDTLESARPSITAHQSQGAEGGKRRRSGNGLGISKRFTPHVGRARKGLRVLLSGGLMMPSLWDTLGVEHVKPTV